MKRLIEWLIRETRLQSIASSDDSSDKAADRIEDSGPGKDTQDQCDFEDTAPYATFELEDGPLSDAEEDIGVDPYNTSRFDTEK